MGERVFGAIGSEAFAVVGLTVAVGLALYWFLRGAPIGQAVASDEGVGAPPAKLRDRLAGATVLGALGVMLGGYVAVRFGIGWSIPVFAFGFGVLLLSIRANRRYRHESPTLRRLAGFGDAVLTGALLAGVLIVGNVLAFTYGGRPIDLSLDQSYHLESLTINQLADLGEPVTFTLFYGGEERAIGQPMRVRQLLELFEAEAPELVRVEVLDPFADPVRARELAEQVPGLQLTEGGGVILSMGEGDDERHIIVPNSEMFAVEMPDEPGTDVVARTEFLGEAAITSALIQLKSDERPLVVITEGHGEGPIAELVKPGLGQLRGRLESVGLEVVAANPAEGLPEDAVVVIVAAPTQPLGPESIARLRSYYDRGGRLIVVQGNQVETGLEAWLDEQGVAIGDGLVADPQLALRGQPFYPFAPIRPGSDHPIVDPLEGRMVLVPVAAPIDAKLGARAPAGRLVMPLVQTGRGSWVETDPGGGPPRLDPEADTPGPVVVAAAVADRPSPSDRDGELTPRLVVLSSPGAIDNQAVAVPDAVNLDLIVNALSWLGPGIELVGIAPRTYVARVLKVEENLRAKLVLLPTLMAASILIGLGTATYLSRRE